MNLANWKGPNAEVKDASIAKMGLNGWRTNVGALQKLHHPNIIHLLGPAHHSQPQTLCLVLEHCNAGDLSSAFLRVTSSPNFFFHVAKGIAWGMSCVCTNAT